MKAIKVTLTLTNDMLGMRPGKTDILAKYVASKAPSDDMTDEEIELAEHIDNLDERTTVFARDDDDTPILYDYQIKGFFKEAIGALAKAGKDGYEGGKACAKIKAYKKTVDLMVFPYPRRIHIDLHGMKMGEYLERPLRAATPMGERITIARSEVVPEGATLTFGVRYASDNILPMLKEALDYGEFHGLSQWRNAGYGTFTWEEVEDIPEV